MKGIYVNTLGARIPVIVASMEERKERIAKRDITIVTVELELEGGGAWNRRGETTLKMEGFPRDFGVAFYGSCADSGVTATLELERKPRSKHEPKLALRLFHEFTSGREYRLGSVYFYPSRGGYRFIPNMPHRRSSRKSYPTAISAVPRWATKEATRVEDLEAQS